MKNKKGQSTLELLILIAIITAALVSMTIYVKRAIQGKFRQSADSIGEQYSPSAASSVDTDLIESAEVSQTIYQNEGEFEAQSFLYTESFSNMTRTSNSTLKGFANESMFW
ncbi:MAG: hypothetical protein KJ880_04615 [Candidatus Omnitrophica bacterium]|nr:hypothetical protein [Candidatus Omnitrophota bacterium]MBU1869561.1 hypothetical protein [Candidatus Omnitrophota bacterium]